MQDLETPEYASEAELTRFLGRSPQFVRALRETGKIRPDGQVGGTYIYSMMSLARAGVYADLAVITAKPETQPTPADVVS